MTLSAELLAGGRKKPPERPLSAERIKNDTRKDSTILNLLAASRGPRLRSPTPTKQKKSNDFKHRGISWNNLTVLVAVRQKVDQVEAKSERVVLRSVYGSARPGEMVGVIGCTGTGKSTLLDVLAGEQEREVRKDRNSQITVDGQPINPNKMRVALVPRTDVSASPPPSGWTPKKTQRSVRVHALISEWKLEACRNALIGIKGRLKGISDSEKKRLALACEVGGQKAPLNALSCACSSSRTPTSSSATNRRTGWTPSTPSCLVNILHDVAKKQKKCVVLTMNQPSDDVFNLFDKRVSLFFPSLNSAGLIPFLHRIARPFNQHKRWQEVEKPDVFFSKGENELICPKNSGHAEHAFRMLAPIDTDTAKTFEDRVRLCALVVGCLNWQTPVEGPTVSTLEGVLFNCGRDLNLLFLFPSIHEITAEFPVMSHEHESGHFSASAYFVAKSLAELPEFTILSLVYSSIVYWMVGLEPNAENFGIFCLLNVLQSWAAISIGSSSQAGALISFPFAAYAGAALFASEDLAHTIVPLFVLPMLLCSGYYVNLSPQRLNSIPIYFQWLSYASWFRHGFEGLEINQWANITTIQECEGVNKTTKWKEYFLSPPFCPAATGKALLARRNMDHEWLLVSGLILGGIVVVARLAGLVFLTCRMRLTRP
ncbi:CRE-WHT-4 protein [Aphelenchoides fujianensis]|nr:CRE-WHT-4 protein [Aphelenchoides fujianensis]